MALYESKELGIDESLIIQETHHGSGLNQSVAAYSGGLYQLIYGGVTDQSGGGTIEVYLKPSDSQQETLVDSVAAPVFSTSSITIGYKAASIQMNRSDELKIKTTGTGAYKIYFVFQKIG